MEPVLLTKLFAPMLRSDIVSRRHLVQMIDRGFSSGSKLTLISASAGYGKTTLITQWLNETGYPNCWLSISESDNEPTRFFFYLITTIQKFRSNMGLDAMNLLKGQKVSPDAVISSLINDLVLLPNKLILVLDDYHEIHAQPIHLAIKLLIDHQPPNLHFVIIIREDPPIALSRLRARGQITEIRIDDLRFSSAEASGFFQNTMNVEIKDEAVKKLVERTGGWVAGLQLAALAIKGYSGDKVDSFIDEFRGNHKYIIDFLVDEVLCHQCNEIREFLLYTSMLERFCAPLCNELLSNTNSKAILNELEQSNLFLVPLDENRIWYRYHHLFADSLSSELLQEEKEKLNLKAAQWFDTNGHTREAIEYAFKSENTDEAFKLVEKVKTEMFERGPLTTLVKWIDMLPEDRVLKSEPLSVNKAFALMLTGDYQKLDKYLVKLDDEFMNHASNENKGRLLSLRAFLVEPFDGKAALELAQKALDVMGCDDVILRTGTMNIVAGVLKVEGSVQAAIEVSQRAYDYGCNYDNSFNTLVALVHYSGSLDLLLRRLEALEQLQFYLDERLRNYIGPKSSTGIIYMAMAYLLYEANELEKANEYAEKGMELCRRMSIYWLNNLEPVNVYLKSAMGNYDAAFDDLKQYKITDHLLKTDFHFKLSAIEAELFIKKGQMDKAVRWATYWGLSSEDSPKPSREQSYLTYARVLIMQNLLDEALKLLDKLEISAQESQRKSRLISIYILQSIVKKRQGYKNEAANCLSKAVVFAAEGDYCRAFLNESPEFIELLAEIHNASPTFVRRLMEHVKNTHAPENQSQMHCDKPNYYIDPLSDRELELLRQMASGASNREVADKLYLSLNTVQWHISHIYAKLDVKNRTQAILKGKELNLI